MEKLNLTEVSKYVEDNIGIFHSKRISRLDNLKLSKVLKRKNPYLFKAKHVLTSEEIIRGIMDAHISSNEETIFGDWLEGLAIFINNKVYGGRKSGIPNIDLEFDKDNIRYIVNIKSGPNWGNSSQIKKMVLDFNTAARTIRTSGSEIHIVAVNGCCYGQDNNPDKGTYYKYCGQRFWEFISGDPTLYVDIIEPLGHKAKEKNDEFLASYSHMVNKFTREFSIEYCNDKGEILWDRIVKFNSQK
ncbi:cytosolic protein [Zunongwangia sp. SCSIO 43204]|uniref:PmeII family type II restriction endonuclease n=1 Tax=Zunongwangia sp. SCSIO 43204 TaxID=2779359 RepID=UPI001CA87693|nr:PmeII family type II restriction endonuclease [Zunongwangia sp. SCSIO 43204]UAB83879.1 cytosolic protein [Zunongwangia sp. SCSIO 43204]